MANISAKELSAIDDQLSMEQLLMKKYKTFATTTTDTAIKQKYEQIADRHQQHFNTLLNHLN